MDGLIILGIVLLILGFVFVGIEMIIPGFGVNGIIGICCLVGGVFLTSSTVQQATIIIMIVLVLLAIMFWIFMSLFSKGKIKSPLILKEQQNRQNGFISSTDLNYLLGKKGVASTDLRPSGRGVFDEIEFDVISEGRYILKGSNIEIYKVINSKLIVKENSKAY